MNISISEQDGVTLLVVSGSLDTFTSDQLTETVMATLRKGARWLVADLADTQYVSSAGLRALLTGVKEARVLGGDMRLAALRTQVLRVMTVSGFASIFSIHDDVPGAIASFAGT